MTQVKEQAKNEGKTFSLSKQDNNNNNVIIRPYRMYVVCKAKSNQIKSEHAICSTTSDPGSIIRY